MSTRTEKRFSSSQNGNAPFSDARVSSRDFKQEGRKKKEERESLRWRREEGWTGRGSLPKMIATNARYSCLEQRDRRIPEILRCTRLQPRKILHPALSAATPTDPSNNPTPAFSPRSVLLPFAVRSPFSPFLDPRNRTTDRTTPIHKHRRTTAYQRRVERAACVAVSGRVFSLRTCCRHSPKLLGDFSETGPRREEDPRRSR